MNYVASGTPENIALAQQVNSRLRADSSYVAARAFLFRALGFGAFACLAGIGVGAAAYGWATLNQFDTAAEKIAAAMQAALSDVTLKTKGEVTLTDNVLKLEGLPKASATPTPTKAQLGSDAAPASKAAVNTTFTVFKQVPYLDGQIVTGWNFKDSAEQPYQQYCYFSRRSNEAKGQVEIKIDLAMDGKTLPQPQKSDVNLEILARNCVWHEKG
ncbi:hypothetical protein ABID82_005359 [Methylobacterium sp. PvP062]|jgi:hypothetical protein|uniref:Uncharacterized protein n=2 Tax=Methylobacterium radiotolerans TaxID=31998 RepID=B1LTJ0_METRJ|nr:MULTISPECIES: hypothetical protein [Methylobacterium]MCX7331394.1 hypothetical protein [Hyphomicrobiales bacterium]GAN52195.1 hypothetical protein ME121_6313 [Methylobacterium sp. ME121]ACB23936.1 conserved hypothetical protein [Methylobacterium radiotolerans JCM 2831]KIU34830.1 hypothetical protein SR39_10100 [Methylobacterium radiotolerans]KTS04045.1 hypothetical protein SB3_24915 [Methylobacterium radiotolerans]